MLAAVFVLSAMGMVLGFGLGLAARIYHVDSDPLVEEISAMMPGTHCGQCGYAGCNQAAEAIAKGEASVSCCPPGGKKLAECMAAKLGLAADFGDLADEPTTATIAAELCTGCTRCYKVCPTDAIVGANKQIHAVMSAACTGCGACVKACPEECIALIPERGSLDNWYWPKPVAAPGC